MITLLEQSVFLCSSLDLIWHFEYIDTEPDRKCRTYVNLIV
jgi:hypothetical protein